ncbi:hypothetical protein RW095_01565 [Paraburkholderia kirstenboschensis]|uniref:Uncharacterized protein n=1 Tax=Paraburkholderia kirstenboschensis TaxID=1245436 RepID=A0ABZ0ECI3_9BURK|nr:hypothetical protein [Paraburkholderia kirstenboschensis]WOD14226.1 hypothetical protein RW095_01565 [Paraburkholderia kirstenboschensis]
MLATKPCIATCVIDGVAVTLTFFPDTGFLRIDDVTGVRSRETRWSAPWRSLVTTFRELSETPEGERPTRICFRLSELRLRAPRRIDGHV